MDSGIKRISPAGEKVLKFFNPVQIAFRLWEHRELIRQLTWREVSGHYRGSFLGLGWSFIQPLLMLCIYTFVFSVVFQAKWGGDLGGGRASFALILFLGLIVFNVFSETVGSAPSLILGHVNYVKKVVFPLEIFPIVRVLSVTINSSFSLAILLVGVVLVYHLPPLDSDPASARLAPSDDLLSWLRLFPGCFGGICQRRGYSGRYLCDDALLLSFPNLLSH